MSLILLLEALLACLLILIVAEIRRLEVWSIRMESMMSERPHHGVSIFEEVIDSGARRYADIRARDGMRPMRGHARRA